MKKLEGEPSGAAERFAIGAVALKTRPAGEAQSAKLALARDWGEFLAHEGDAGQGDRLPALKENATKTIKLDPTFAFGFYVLGRIATLEGLEGHGVRFFRRALGIDPNLSEAERHLRLLTGSTPALPVVEEAPTTPSLSPPEDELATLPAMTLPPELAPRGMDASTPIATGARAITAALEPSLAPSAPIATPAVEEARPSRSAKSSMGYAVWALAVAVVAVVGALAWGLGRPSTPPELTATTAPVARASASAHVSASAPAHTPPSPPASAPAHAPLSSPASVSASASAPSSTSENATASTAAGSSTPPIASAPLVPGPSQGVLKTRWNTGHRFFVDGVVVGETPAQVLVTCGEHVVKVGSGGREQTIDVPCATTVTVDP
jgi:hypothetical protein